MAELNSHQIWSLTCGGGQVDSCHNEDRPDCSLQRIFESAGKNAGKVTGRAVIGFVD